MIERCCKTLTTHTVTREAVTKSNITLPWRNLLTTSAPPMSVAGNMLAVPIHQLADWPSANEVMTTAIAAGLKKCLLLRARIYFDDMARIAAQPRNRKLSSDFAGSIISARIRAVIYVDSILAGTAKMPASIEFAAQQIKMSNAVDTSNSSGEKGSNWKYDSTTAIATRPPRT